jgi:hypothetical protein
VSLGLGSIEERKSWIITWEYRRKKALQKTLLLATCSSPRVSSRVHTRGRLDSAKCTIGRVYFNTRGQFAACTILHAARWPRVLLYTRPTVGRVYINTRGQLAALLKYIYIYILFIYYFIYFFFILKFSKFISSQNITKSNCTN